VNSTITLQQQPLQPYNTPLYRLYNRKNQGDKQIRPHFQNNYVNENFDETFEDNMHCCDGSET
jgi:hypothetical protein